MALELSAETIRKTAIYGLVLFMAIPFGFYYGHAYWDSGAAGALVGAGLGVGITVCGLLLVSFAANLFATLAGERRAGFSNREKLEADMQQARYYKMNKEYAPALAKVNAILQQDPEFPEALFLKAQIVWEGYGNRDAALSNLLKIQDLVQDESATVRRWAGSLMEELERSNSHLGNLCDTDHG